MKKFLIVSLLFVCACAYAMEPDAPEEQPSSTLRNLCIAAVVPQLPTLFKNSNQLAQLPPDVRKDLWHRHMFGPNQHILERNPAILWLLSQCPLPHRSELFQDHQFAIELRECNNMRIRLLNNTSVEVIEVDTNNQLFFCDCESAIKCAQFSPDGKFIYLITFNKFIGIFDTQTWTQAHQAQLHGCRGIVEFVCLTPDTRAITSGKMNRLFLHDTLTGNRVCDLKPHSDEYITNVKLSPDGNQVYIFCASGLTIPNENIQEIDRAFNPLNLEVHRVDISTPNALLAQLPDLTLEQLLVVQLVYALAKNGATADLFAHQHIQDAYNSLPENIRAVIEAVLPRLKNYVPHFDMPMPGSEPDQKRRRVAFDQINDLQ